MMTGTQRAGARRDRALAKEWYGCYQDADVKPRHESPLRDASVRRCLAHFAAGATLSEVLRRAGDGGESALGVITLRGDADLLDAFLSAGCEHHKQSDPLITAIGYRHADCVAVLLRHGSDPRQREFHLPGEPLRRCAGHKKLTTDDQLQRICLSLLRSGADVAEADPTGKNEDLWTGIAAMVTSARQKGNVEVAGVLATALVPIVCSAHARRIDAVHLLADLSVESS